MSDAWDSFLNLMTRAESFIEASAESFWLYPAIYLVSLIDGFFPVVPSDAAVIASATAWSQSGNGWFEFANPMLIAIVLAAALGAWCGDQVAYLIGAKLDVIKLRLFKSDKGAASLAWAERKLEHRGTLFIIAGRFIPMGRVAINVSAGALRYPHRRFMGIDAIGVSLWALWSVALGTFAGALFEGNLVLSVSVGVAGGVALGMLVDKLMALFGFGPVDLPELAAQVEPPDGGDADDAR